MRGISESLRDVKRPKGEHVRIFANSKIVLMHQRLKSICPDFHADRVPAWLIGVGILLIAGCDDQKSRMIERPFAGQTVSVSVPQELGLGESWKPILDEWSEQTGASFRFIPVPPSAPSRAGDIAPGQGLASGDAIASGDLYVVPFDQLGELAADNAIAPLPRALLESDATIGWLDFFSGLRRGVLTIGGAPSVVPFSCPVLTCYFRRDLLEKAGRKPPETWDDYQTLIDQLPSWAPGLSAVEPWGKDFRATMFLARAVSSVKTPESYSVFFDLETGAPLIDSPGFERALQQSIAAVSKMPPAVKNYSPADCRRLFLEGNAAMAIAFEPGKTDQKPEQRPEALSISFTRLPGSPQIYNRKSQSWTPPREGSTNFATLAPFSGLAGTVRKGIPPERAEAAWNLLTFLDVDRYDQAFASVSKSVCRESQLESAPAWLSPDLRSEELFAYLGATTDSLRNSSVVAELPVVGRLQFREALTAGISDALEGRATPAAALKSVSTHWTAIAKKVGIERVRDSYRRCLGLPPTVKVPTLR
jgi:multiple sugar transport system substrate-binding protein